MPQWVGAKTQLLLINRADEISREDRAAWADHFKCVRRAAATTAAS